jgi:hypothetical protein
MDLQLLDRDTAGASDGFMSLRGQRPADWDSRLADHLELLDNAKNLDATRHRFRLLEALSSADFPVLHGDSLHRLMLANYQSAPRCMRQICQISRNVPDFREQHRARIYGDLLQRVGELGLYTQMPISESDDYPYSLSKWGKLIEFSWEAFVNGDLGIWQALPKIMADRAVNTEERWLTGLFFDANGPLAAYFAGNGGAAAIATTPLTEANLETACEEMLSFTDPTGNSPILADPVYLMVPPALKLTGMRIVKSINLTWTESAGGAATHYGASNPLADLNLRLLVNQWLPIIVTSGTVGQTCWALFSDPGSGLAAGEIGYLQGRNNPEVFIKQSEAQRLGGVTSPWDGSFTLDSCCYKVRHCFGGTVLDGRAGWASYGQTP